MDTPIALQLAASLITLSSVWAYGNKSRWGAYLGVASEVPWLALMIFCSMWGLIPLNAVMFYMHVRNIWKMR